MFYKSRLVWAGDYAYSEPDCGQNLYHIAENNEYLVFNNPSSFNPKSYQFIVNHTKREYVDKQNLNTNSEDNDGYIIHPLPLLVSEGNGRGGGDYRGNNETLCGSWARDVISVECDIPHGYTELVCGFRE
jgi:hypothetical protein